ncbi:lactosylceramide 4-alpha-galactosyltransferase-like isoform X2 [Eriocheir sinensis]|uniref:lactosylceramide 4-alpha-galactosyltransferase-like isoform X2 n=1 Tax=Eriocheir sinensis TaxID=95602 RepID=UPI0021CA7696|nr:lactosylceramide 4-alpha-galactosyltransferase-like isoform X2 [Eriocheir sinensis]
MCRKIFLMGHWGLKGRAGLRALILTISGFLIMSIISSTSVLVFPAKDASVSTGSRVRREVWQDAPLLLTPLNSSLIDAENEHYYMKHGAVWMGTLRCPMSAPSEEGTYLRLPDFFSPDNEWRRNDKNILMAETSCNPKPPYRAWCAVESMAHQNPSLRVWYVMTAAAVEGSDGLATALVQRYPNLRPVTADLRRLFTDTPLQHVYNTCAWCYNTTWPAVNLSDMVRLALAWTAGGMYSDTDVVCIKSVASLQNVLGLSDDYKLINNGVFHFHKRHPLLRIFMETIAENFKGNQWGEIGPQALTRATNKTCGWHKLVVGSKCKGVTLLSPKAFYPIGFGAWKNAFSQIADVTLNKMYPDSYLIHMWNKVSHDKPVRKGSGSIYDTAAKTLCPLSWKTATKNSLQF